jgi:hypothetical protein
LGCSSRTAAAQHPIFRAVCPESEDDVDELDADDAEYTFESEDEDNGDEDDTKKRKPIGRNQGRDQRREHSGIPRRVPVQADGSCCVAKLEMLKSQLKQAERTAKEVLGRSKGKGAAASSSDSSTAISALPDYNKARLFAGVVDNAFDLMGNCLLHQGCLAAGIGVCSKTVTMMHRRVLDLRNNPIKEISKAKLVAHNLENQVIVPESESHLTQQQYLKLLGSDSQVKVPAKMIPTHGHSGKTSNRALRQERNAFILWVQNNRSPTGRTPDLNCRYHGAV